METAARVRIIPVALFTLCMAPGVSAHGLTTNPEPASRQAGTSDHGMAHRGARQDARRLARPGEPAEQDAKPCSIVLTGPADGAIGDRGSQAFSWIGSSCAGYRYDFSFWQGDSDGDHGFSDVKSTLTFTAAGGNTNNGQTLPAWSELKGDATYALWQISASNGSSGTDSAIRCLNRGIALPGCG